MGRGPNQRQTRTDEIDFSRVGGVEQDKCDTFNGTRLPKTLEIRKTSLSLSLLMYPLDKSEREREREG